MDEADVEHAMVKELIGQLQDMNASDDHYDAKVKVLSEYVKHHVKEEETEMFQEVEDCDADLEEIGQQLVERKRELMGALKERPAADRRWAGLSSFTGDFAASRRDRKNNHMQTRSSARPSKD